MKKHLLAKTLALLLLCVLVCSLGITTAVAADGETPLKVRYASPGSLCDEYESVISDINAKLQADGVNIELEIVRIPWDSWVDKTNLMLSTGEPLELIHVMQDFIPVSTYAGREMLTPLNDLLENYPDLKAHFTEDEWAGMTVNGQIYSVPARWTAFYSQDLIYFRQDLMESLNLTPPTTPEELITVAKKLQAGFPGDKKAYMWQHQLSQPPVWLHRTFESWPFYVDLSYGIFLVDKDGGVRSYLESEEFKKAANYFEQLYKEGLIHPDILSVPDDTRANEGKAGHYLFGLGTLGYDVELTIQQSIPEASIGETSLSPEQPRLKSMLIGNSNAIPVTSENPEGALAFLDWLYKDQANHDLFLYGVEGKQWTKTAEGRKEQVQNASGNPVYFFDEWMIADANMLRYDVLATEKQIASGLPDTYEAAISPVSGFNFDPTAVEDKLQNVNAVILTDIYPVKYGIVSYDAGIEAALKNLKAAGLDEVIAEYKAQFEAYLASK